MLKIFFKNEISISIQTLGLWKLQVYANDKLITKLCSLAETGVKELSFQEPLWEGRLKEAVSYEGSHHWRVSVFLSANPKNG